MENREIIENNEVIENNEIVEEKKTFDVKGMLQKELNIKEALTVIGAFVIIFGYIGMLIYPNWKKVKSSLDELDTMQEQIANYELNINNIPNLEKELSYLESELDNEKKMLSHNMEDGMFLVGLSNLINSLGIDLVSYTVEDTIPYNSFYAIPTNIEVRGNYNHIRTVMSYLEEQKNTTQILDYNMETYIEEPKESQVSSAATTETIIDSVVYWTEAGEHYHKGDCSLLQEEQEAADCEIFTGTSKESEKASYCEVCKPYTVAESNSESTTTTTSTPKAKGDIVARFKFVMYSSENPSNNLNNSDVSTWQPGKYNPFVSTSR